MHKTLVIKLLLILASSVVVQAQDPVITYAGSLYKTTAGAIGPSGVTATRHLNLKINSHQTILLDSALISGFKIMGHGIIVPTNREGTIEFEIRIYTHQKRKLWYHGEIIFQDISVPTEVYKASSLPPSSTTDDEYPAIILYLRTADSSHQVTRENFDQEHSQYNK